MHDIELYLRMILGLSLMRNEKLTNSRVYLRGRAFNCRLVGQLVFKLSRPASGCRENLIFIFALLCGSSKVFIKPFKSFIKAIIKPSQAPQRSVKIKILVNFYFSATF